LKVFFGVSESDFKFFVPLLDSHKLVLEAFPHLGEFAAKGTN
jgi:hypothetical protein